MEQYVVYVKDMLSPIMDFLENCGYDKHTLWGNIYNDFSSIMRFYEKLGFEYYDPPVTKKYINEIWLKYQKGEISRSFYLKIRKAGDRLDEFYNTGKLDLSFNKKQSKFILNDENSKLLSSFLNSRDFHLNTKWDFAWAIRRYLHYFEKRGIHSVKEIKTKDIREFIVDTGSKVSSGSLHNIFCYLRKFYKFLHAIDDEIPEKIPLFSYKIPRKTSIRNPITDDELNLIQKNINTSTDIGKRDMAIIELGASTGLRAIDIVNLKLTDIDWLKGEIHIFQSKTGKSLSLPIIPKTGEYIKDYILNSRPKSECKEIFLREKAPFTSITAVTVAYMFNKYCGKAGIKRVAFDGKGFHSLRCRLAKNMITAGLPITTLSQVLGHTNIETTKIYLSLDSENLKECSLNFENIRLERSELL